MRGCGLSIRDPGSDADAGVEGVVDERLAIERRDLGVALGDGVALQPQVGVDELAQNLIAADGAGLGRTGPRRTEAVRGRGRRRRGNRDSTKKAAVRAS